MARTGSARCPARWRSAHDLLADNEKQETEEWAKLSGDFQSISHWPPRWSPTRS